jgi:hypothetical protein
MKCECGRELIWNIDHDLEDVGLEGNGIVTIYSCPNDECEVDIVEVYKSFDDEGSVRK